MDRRRTNTGQAGSTILEQLEEFGDDPMFARRKGRPHYTNHWTEEMEEAFEADREHGRGNIAMMNELPTLVMNQVRLSYKTASTPYRDAGAQNT